MDADGSNVRRLTEGKWTDTMCDWSPTGEWIAFASDRGGDFEVWLIQPDGTGLHKLVGGGGRNNHPHFSPDGRWIVFTSKRAGFSAEEISLPAPAPALRRPVRRPARRDGADPADPQRLRGRDPRRGRCWRSSPWARGSGGKARRLLTLRPCR